MTLHVSLFVTEMPTLGGEGNVVASVPWLEVLALCPDDTTVLEVRVPVVLWLNVDDVSLALLTESSTSSRGSVARFSSSESFPSDSIDLRSSDDGRELRREESFFRRGGGGKRDVGSGLGCGRGALEALSLRPPWASSASLSVAMGWRSHDCGHLLV